MVKLGRKKNMKNEIMHLLVQFSILRRKSFWYSYSKIMQEKNAANILCG